MNEKNNYSDVDGDLPLMCWLISSEQIDAPVYVCAQVL